jgi:ribosomal protein L34E
LKVLLRTPSGHTVVHVKQKMHSVEQHPLSVVQVLGDIDVHDML